MASSKLKVPILLEWEDIKAYMELYDIIEVVRCKECKHNPDRSDDDMCPFVDSDGHVREFPSEHDFCSRGERRE